MVEYRITVYLKSSFMKKQFFYLTLLLVVINCPMTAQAPIILNSAIRTEVIDSICKKLNREYIFADIAVKMSDFISTELKAGKYDAITDPKIFSDRLTADLRSSGHDMHLAVSYDPPWLEEGDAPAEGSGPTPEELKFYKEMNYGLSEVRILNGNIGYLRIDEFVDPRYAGEVVVAAMNFLSNTRALIFDVRVNGGGYPETVELIISYLYNSSERIHLNDFYTRMGNRTDQYWTSTYVPGKRLDHADVYVLTSRNTFSAAEEFCYDLKALKRATLVGETTGGGANPVDPRAVSHKFGMYIPRGRAINPITHTNWEGSGIQPDVKASVSEALVKAQILALEKLKEKDKENPLYDWALLPLKVEETEPVQSIKLLRSYAGRYGKHELSFENGKLYYQSDISSKTEVQLIQPGLLAILENNAKRIQMVQENNQVIGIAIQRPGFTSPTIRKN